MKKHAIIALSLVLVLFCGACASPSGRQGKDAAKPGIPSRLKPTLAETPQEIRNIEVQIDQTSIILAREAFVYVSKNYEMDVSLSGEDVSKDLDTSGARENVARGSSIAFIRNLKLQCDHQIKVKIADFGTKPFIKISALGPCSHIILGDESNDNQIKRSQRIVVNNADVSYFNDKGERTAAQTGN